MNTNEDGDGSTNTSHLRVLAEAIEARKRFAPKYRAARSHNELLLELAEALVLASRLLMKCVQGKEDLKNPSSRLFCECLEINRKGLFGECGSKLAFEEVTQICDQSVAFACAVFANLCDFPKSKGESLLRDLNEAYLDNLGREDIDAPKRLLDVAGLTPSARIVAEIAACLAKKPWLVTELDDFMQSWKRLPAGATLPAQS